jgi:hypothetical protein
MAKESTMPEVDMKKEFSKLNAADQHFIKKVEEMNLKRASDAKLLRTKNKVTGLVIGAAVIGIYAYTILSVKQEKFLDELDAVPVKKTAPS